MRSGVRRGRRNRKRGKIILLSIIIAFFIVALVIVGLKFGLSAWKTSDKNDDQKQNDNLILVTDIEVTCERPVIRAGESIALNVKILPENATDQTVNWTVSGDMGTVDVNGIFVSSIEAEKSDVEVTATSNDGTEVFGSVTIRVLEAVDPSKPMVALTFDDGPHATNTPILLDILEENYEKSYASNT